MGFGSDQRPRAVRDDCDRRSHPTLAGGRARDHEPDFPVPREFDTPAAIKAAARSALEEDYRYMTYTDSAGLPELRQAIAAKLALENGIEADTGDIIVTVGVKEGVALAALACLRSGDEVLLPTPAWVTYEPLIRLTGATPVSIPLREGADFPPSGTEMAARISPCTPGHPVQHAAQSDRTRLPSARVGGDRGPRATARSAGAGG